jgi:hypothetical protein
MRPRRQGRWSPRRMRLREANEECWHRLAGSQADHLSGLPPRQNDRQRPQRLHGFYHPLREAALPAPLISSATNHASSTSCTATAPEGPRDPRTDGPRRLDRSAPGPRTRPFRSSVDSFRQIQQPTSTGTSPSSHTSSLPGPGIHLPGVAPQILTVRWCRSRRLRLMAAGTHGDAGQVNPAGAVLDHCFQVGPVAFVTCREDLGPWPGGCGRRAVEETEFAGFGGVRPV